MGQGISFLDIGINSAIGELFGWYHPDRIYQDEMRVQERYKGMQRRSVPMNYSDEVMEAERRFYDEYNVMRQGFGAGQPYEKKESTARALLQKDTDRWLKKSDS